MHQITQNTITTFTTIKTSPTAKILKTQVKLPKTHFPKLVISSKWGGKRSARTSSSQNKKLINSIVAVASHFKILPEPFDSLLKEYLNNGGGSGGGNGGGGIVKFGNGGRGGGRGRKGRMWVWVTGVVMSALGMWVVMEKEGGRRESGVKVAKWVMGVLGFCCVMMGGKRWREIGVWVLGFCCGIIAVVVGSNAGLVKGNDFDGFLKVVNEVKESLNGVLFGGRKKRRLSLAAVKRWY